MVVPIACSKVLLIAPSPAQKSTGYSGGRATIATRSLDARCPFARLGCACSMCGAACPEGFENCKRMALMGGTVI
jgi:hypothetical protein